jgi:Regulator of ribonuclease activity B
MKYPEQTTSLIFAFAAMEDIAIPDMGTVEYQTIFPTDAQRTSFKNRVLAEGFKEVPCPLPDENGEFFIEICKESDFSEASLDDAAFEVERLVAEYGGEVEGWNLSFPTPPNHRPI